MYLRNQVSINLSVTVLKKLDSNVHLNYSTSFNGTEL